MTDGSDDRYYKIRPVMERVKKNFLKLEHEVQFSIDEMIILGLAIFAYM